MATSNRTLTLNFCGLLICLDDTNQKSKFFTQLFFKISKKKLKNPKTINHKTKKVINNFQKKKLRGKGENISGIKLYSTFQKTIDWPNHFHGVWRIHIYPVYDSYPIEI